MDSLIEGYLWKLINNSNFDEHVREFIQTKVNQIESNEEAKHYIAYLKENQLPDLNEQYDMLIKREE